jgi:hypothetical protein
MQTRTRNSPAASLFALVAGCCGGAYLWLWAAGFDLGREGWDNPTYFTRGLPALLVLCFVLGAVAPVRAWRWGIAPMAAQAVLAFAGNPTANLLPLGLLLFAGLAVPCAGAAALGGRLRLGKAAPGALASPPR